MSKKNLAGGLESLMGNLPDRHKKEIITIDNREITNNPEKETKATFIVNESLLEKLRAIAYWDRAMIKDILHIALSNLVTEYENKNGVINPIPKK